MAVSDEYLDYILDQLRQSGPVTSRKMFGGAGLYRDGFFFALIADDVLYFKVDELNREDYKSARMGPFRPFGKDSYAMHYYEVPVDVVEDTEDLGRWANKALQVARRKPAKSKKAGRKKRLG